MLLVSIKMIDHLGKKHNQQKNENKLDKLYFPKSQKSLCFKRPLRDWKRTYGIEENNCILYLVRDMSKTYKEAT